MNPFEDTPFASTPDAETQDFLDPLHEVEERISLLRSSGKLTEATLREYYGETRFEQVAESNAIEGSTLDVGETRLAVLKGVTSLVHDPQYVTDARALNSALVELEQLATEDKPVTISEAHRVHELVLAGRAGAGVFRRDSVDISGSRYRPPATWTEVMDGMESWENWLATHRRWPALLKAAILHAWFVYVHPYIDGNGRTARALSNLQLVRGGFPPILIRKHRDRDRYIDALEKADFGDLRPFLDLVTDRAVDAVRDLERAAAKRQGYSALAQKERNAFANRLGMWNVAVSFLFEALQARLRVQLGDSTVALRARRHADLSLDDFIDLSKGDRVSMSWAFSVSCSRPDGSGIDYLCWTDEIGNTLARTLGEKADRPSLRWSVPSSHGLRRWRNARADECPYAVRSTFQHDRWVVVTEGGVKRHSPTELAEHIAEALIDQLVPPSSL